MDPSALFLVTGGAGFIGSHLVEALLARGQRVLAVDDLSTGSADNLATAVADPNFRFVRSSVTDETVLEELAAEASVIVHLAAAVGVNLVVERPAYTIETNIMGTQAVLRAAMKHGCRVLLASTSEVYGKGTRIPFTEDDDVLLGATSKSRWSYAGSKMVDEMLAFGYQREFGTEVVPFRLFNTIGPRQSSRYGMVVPRFVRQALQNEPITVYGDGTQSRCFCDVRDVVDALIGLSGHPTAAGSVYNIGSSEEISIRGLAERIRGLLHSDSPITTVPYSEAYPPGFEDMHRRVPDTRRIRSLLGWQPRITLDQTVERVAEWLRTCSDA